MGNVLAATSPPTGLSNNGKTPSGVRIRGNPGTMEDLHKKCKDIFPNAFEGARIVVNKPLSSHFQITHSLVMSTMQPSGYRFGANFVGANIVGPGEAYPVLVGDITPCGNVNANIIHQLNDRTNVKIQAQFEDNRAVGSITTNFKSTDSTTSVTFVNPNIVTASGLGVIQYLQSVTPNVDLGAELVYQRAQGIPFGGMAVLALSGRLKAADESYILSGTLSTSRINACYYHKGMENLAFGVEVETDFREGSSTGTFGYHYELPKANLSFKGSVDSNLVVSAVLEKKLQPLPFTFILSGLVNHGGKKSDYRFGCGLMVG